MGEKAAAALEETGEGCSAAPETRAGVPWLVKLSIEPDEEDFHITKTNYAFHNIFKQNNQSCGEFIPALSNRTFYQKPSHQGWLIIVCDEADYDYTPSSKNYGDCFLWNPMTYEEIQLPTLLEFYKGEYAFNDCVLSSPPHNDDNNDSMVLFFGNNWDEDGNPEYTFLFCRPGETKWRIHKLSMDIVDLISELRHKSVHCFKGKFYLMCTEYNYVGEHPDYHLEIEYFSKDTDLTISVKSFHVKNEVLFPLLGRKVAYSESQYAESHDELFRVDIIYSESCGEVISIEVVRLNFPLMEWEKVNSLGDQVLFIGNRTIAYSSAADLGLTSGCLYYLLFNRSLHKLEIESTGNTVTWSAEQLLCTDWVIMPTNVHGRVGHIVGSEDEENGFLMAPIETSTTMVVKDENQGRKSNAGDEEVLNNWNILNQDIVELIAANYLHGKDYKHFRSVCKANREMMPKVQQTSYLSPWLVFSRDHTDTIYSIVNPMYINENYFMKLSDLEGSTIRFQKGGWLLMTREENIFFYNPLTRETVKLPDLDRGYCYSVVSCSSIPTSSDCIVFVMDDRTNGFYINFIRRGEAHWNSHIFDSTNIGKFTRLLDTAFFHNDAFFCVNCLGTVGRFSAKDNSWKVLVEPHEHYFRTGYPAFLVECGGDLLLVKLEYGWMPITIFSLNFSEIEWIKVESLEEHVLFISHTSCVSAVAPVSNMKNKIYFPRLYVKDGGIVFYSLETCSYHCFGRQHSAKDLPDTEGWFRNCTWIEPNRSMSTTNELDWLKTAF